MVILVACCMQLGVAIKDEDLGLIRYALSESGVHPDAKTQMDKALEQYKNNGDMWDFDRNEPSKVFLLAHISSMLTAIQRRTCP